MQQKVAIAVALIHHPQLLLLDEPTLGLDVEAGETVKALVRQIAQEGRAILLTTHQLDVAEAPPPSRTGWPLSAGGASLPNRKPRPC